MNFHDRQAMPTDGRDQRQLGRDADESAEEQRRRCAETRSAANATDRANRISGRRKPPAAATTTFPTHEMPRSLEAITSVAPTLASDVINSSGADGDPNRMTPSSSNNPADAADVFPACGVAGAGMNPIDSNAPSASSQARNGVR